MHVLHEGHILPHGSVFGDRLVRKAKGTRSFVCLFLLLLFFWLENCQLTIVAGPSTAHKPTVALMIIHILLALSDKVLSIFFLP